jgi:hypothetical protein
VRQGGIRVRAVWLFVIRSGKGEGRMSSGSGPREIVVRGKQITAGGSPTMALHARDGQTGAVLAVPMPVRRNGNIVEGREAAEHLASLLILAQGSGARPSWDRDTPETYVFTVASA